MDIVVANMGSSNIGIFLAYENFTFINLGKYSTDSKPMSIASGDFNKDARTDIVVATYGLESVTVYLGLGNGSFVKNSFYTTSIGSLPYSIIIGDLNNDTALDIIIINQGTNNLGVFLGYDNGNFSSMLSFSTGYESSPFSVVLGDFNNDKKLDFAIAKGGTDSLSILLQTCADRIL